MPIYAIVYLPKILTAFFGGLFVFMGIVTFGNDTAFDRIYIGLLVFTGCVCRENINVLSAIAILVLQLIWETVIWNVLSDNELVKLGIYLIALYSVYYFRYDWLAKCSAVIVIVAFASELYWHFNDYDAPEIYWYIFGIASNLLIRHLVFCRVSFVEHYSTTKGGSLNLDWVIYKFSAGLTILKMMMILEYLSRHILGLDSLLVVYYSYTHIIHIIGTITVWAIFNESSKQLIPQLLKA